MTQMLEDMIRIFGGSILDFQDIFFPFAGALFFLFLVIEILRESIDITSGKGVELGRKLILFICVGTILLNYGKLSNDVYAGAMETGREMIPRFEEVNNWIHEGYERGVEDHRGAMELDRSSEGTLTSFLLSVVLAIMSGLGLLLVYLAMVLILVFIAGAYASLALTLVLGPVFITMFVLPELRGTGVKWAVILLSIFLTVPAYVMILKITAALYSGSVNINTGSPEAAGTRSLSHTVESIGMLMVNPLLTFGLIFSVSKIVGSITGSAGNIGEKALAAAGTAAAVTTMAVRGGISALKGGGDSAPGGGAGVPGNAGSGNSDGGGIEGSLTEGDMGEQNQGEALPQDAGDGDSPAGVDIPEPNPPEGQ